MAAMHKKLYGALLLDLIKAFERVPHQWLVRQGMRYEYPMRVLSPC